MPNKFTNRQIVLMQLAIDGDLNYKEIQTKQDLKAVDGLLKMGVIRMDKEEAKFTPTSYGLSAYHLTAPSKKLPQYLDERFMPEFSGPYQRDSDRRDRYAEERMKKYPNYMMNKGLVDIGMFMEEQGRNNPDSREYTEISGFLAHSFDNVSKHNRMVGVIRRHNISLDIDREHLKGRINDVEHDKLTGQLEDAYAGWMKSGVAPVKNPGMNKGLALLGIGAIIVVKIVSGVLGKKRG